MITLHLYGKGRSGREECSQLRISARASRRYAPTVSHRKMLWSGMQCIAPAVVRRGLLEGGSETALTDLSEGRKACTALYSAEVSFIDRASSSESCLRSTWM